MPALSRTLLITGASSGIGRATARLMLEQGHHVIGLSRNCRQFMTAHPRFRSVEADLANLDSLPDVLHSLTNAYPQIDTLISCAGYGRFSPLEEFSYQQIQQLINTDLTSQIFLCRALLPGLKKQSGGNIVLLGSEAALRGSRKGSVYCAAKFGLRGLAQALREECGRSQVSVTIINPGMVDTAFFEPLSFQPGADPDNYIRPHDVAVSIGFVLSASPGTVVDEINLSPLKKVIRFK